MERQRGSRSYADVVPRPAEGLGDQADRVFGQPDQDGCLGPSTVVALDDRGRRPGPRPDPPPPRDRSRDRSRDSSRDYSRRPGDSSSSELESSNRRNRRSIVESSRTSCAQLPLPEKR